MTLNFFLYNVILKISHVHIISYEHRRTQASPLIPLQFFQPLLLLFQSPSSLCIVFFCSCLLQGAIAALCLWFHWLCHKTPVFLQNLEPLYFISVMVLWSWKEWYKYPIEGYREIIFSLAFQSVLKDFLNLFSFLLLSFLIIVFIIIFRYHYLNQTNDNILQYQGQ